MGCGGCKATEPGVRKHGVEEVSPEPVTVQGCSARESGPLEVDQITAEVPVEPRTAIVRRSHPAWAGARQRDGGLQLPEGFNSSDSDATNRSASSRSRPLGTESAYARAASSAASFLAERVLDLDWVARHDDVGYYFKAPVALLLAGLEDEARQALEVAARFAERGGMGSRSSALYEHHPQAPWLWLCWAASRLGWVELADACLDSIYNFRHPVTSSGLARSPYSWAIPFEADFLATAYACKASLLRGRRSEAVASGDSLLRALHANADSMSRRKTFQLRWTWDSGFVQDAGPEQRVSQGEPAQLYNMLGFPAAVLLDLSRAQTARSAEYREGAGLLLDFLRGCSGLESASVASSVVVAAAAAGSYNHGLARSIADSVVARQTPEGLFRTGDPEALDAMDEAAEAVIWLCQAEISMGRCTRL
mmetsp:Transcript_960/g.2446  ORF Transcript_960/g.2446 Transcript_960/m.2446 type:complete len:422 (-) Transcript_960:106-1371(-)